jgi:hypothetical protein
MRNTGIVMNGKFLKEKEGFFKVIHRFHRRKGEKLRKQWGWLLSEFKPHKLNIRFHVNKYFVFADHLDSSLAEPRASALWKGSDVAATAITRGKRFVFPIEPHQSRPLLRKGSSHIFVCYPSKRHESSTDVILQIDFDLGFDHKVTTETPTNVCGSPQQQQLMEYSFNIIRIFVKTTRDQK